MHAVSTPPAQPGSELAPETSRAVVEVRGIHKVYDTGTEAVPSRSRTRKRIVSPCLRMEPSTTLPVSW